MPAGRPSEYVEANCEEVVDLGRQGKSVAQMCAHFDISRQTIDNWAAAHPEFLEALSRAKVHAQAWWETEGVAGMTSDKFNAAVWKKSMEARFRDDYTERKEVGVTINHEDALGELE
ncbi:helix-turn-helix domain-containing protein [Mesorhizobium sp. B2-1-3]|uniref:helix-turn-helix domain-containing protein n=1 Tax=Mesorhizobium sp. B2-1-3 TaxID=2589972 RepID=UPI00112BE8C0|nr:helix-turn-helix domain-containing protein [Mesorhizobium sp. B2-1-3]TPN03819.1 helix-turn-helix domain-containing protein [Mesorhizobium sp. B2-1-3]